MSRSGLRRSGLAYMRKGETQVLDLLIVLIAVATGAVMQYMIHYFIKGWPMRSVFPLSLLLVWFIVYMAAPAEDEVSALIQYLLLSELGGTVIGAGMYQPSFQIHRKPV